MGSLWTRIKEILRKMISGKTIETTLHVTPAVSNRMSNAINLWSKMYKDEAPWLHDYNYKDKSVVLSMNLPAMIASEKARMVVLEMQSTITAPTEDVEKPNPAYKPPTINAFGVYEVSKEPEKLIESVPVGDTARADYLNDQYQRKVVRKLRKNMEYACAKGSMMIKPYVIMPSKTDNEDAVPQMEFDFIQAEDIYPISFDASGKITEVAFVQRIINKDTVYTRLEHHVLKGNTVTVTNKAFKSTNTNIDNDSQDEATDLGTEIPLTDVPQWESLTPEVKISPVDRLLCAYFTMPEANTIDPHSPLGVSCYSRAVNLIREADKQFSRFIWEFEAGEAAVDIDQDALKTEVGADGTRISVLPERQERLFRKVDLGDESTYQPYFPTLRDGSLLNGLNALLMRIEDVCAVSRGTLSDPAAEARTATELKILNQRSYSANLDIQKALEETLRDLIYIMDTYCTLYHIVGDTPNVNGVIDNSNQGKYEVSFEWDDSIITDVDGELGKRITLQNNGLASKIENRMWYFGETEAQAKEALQKIQDENVSNMETNLAFTQSKVMSNAK